MSLPPDQVVRVLVIATLLVLAGVCLAKALEKWDSYKMLIEDHPDEALAIERARLILSGKCHAEAERGGEEDPSDPRDVPEGS